ncbi:MAG TPA: DUF4190 domain-containing protein [Acidimicrobiales bacterium]|jgi:hypothetical protein|nr:DUF4190 domain-containing protein [Acidimicrobiales bacterium]
MTLSGEDVGTPGPGSPGPGYWLASDGQWYPPEQAPGAAPVPPPASAIFPTYPQPGGWDQAQIPYPTGRSVPARPTNGQAIASLVCACAGVIPFLGIVGVILGVIFGFTAKSQIKRTGGVQGGSGLATAGIVISIAITALWIILFAAFGTFHAGTCTGSCSA